ncbi:MAG: hypothetical protein WCO84_04925 [bacterium]
MENFEDDSVIKKTEKRLYSSDPGNLDRQRGRLSNTRFGEDKMWEGQDLNTLQMGQTKKRFPILSLILVFSFIFFLGSLGFAYYLYQGGTNTVSPENIDISLSAPVSLKAGEEFNLQVKITNKNNTALEYTDLIATFPDGTSIPAYKVNDNQYRKTLGTIKPNEVVTETIKASLFGEENANREIKIGLEYRNENSNAIMQKDASFSTIISSSPLSLYFDIPKDANSNQEIVLNVKTVSNSKESLKDVILNLSYPAGFIFKNSVPPATSGEGVWELGTLKQGAEKLVKITGVIQGQNNENKSFRASVGTRNSVDSNKVDVTYASSLKTLTLVKPYVDVSLTLNGSSDDVYVSQDKQPISGEIDWSNNLPVKLLHGNLVVKLTGNSIDKSSIDTEKGFYKSLDNTITWNNNGGGVADSIDVGEEGKATFSFEPLPLLSGTKTIFKNPEINLDLKFKGIRATEGRTEGSVVETTLSRKIKISSNLQISSRALYYSGPFKNTGTLPMTHDQETTYTVVWSVVNSSNDVSGAVARTVLPTNVRWVGTFSPDSENILYDALSREVVWQIGNIKAGVGVIVPSKEISFQVGIIPSLKQVGDYPALTQDTKITGNDDFTNAQISYTKTVLSSKLNSDSLVKGTEAGPVK